MTDLQIGRKSIRELLTIQKKKYIIPDYQRPYRWGKDECDTLWNDIVDAKREKPGDDYFLGTIVTYPDENGDLQVVDGQQRLTSFFLLLRAFYRKLEDQNASELDGLKRDVRYCIWDVNQKSGEVDDVSNIHILSDAIDDDKNGVFLDILETGECNPDAKDNYSSNYRLFIEKCDEFAKNQPYEWSDLCIFILNNCIILPIECPNDDTALIIFNTLNTRGMPLSKADIFKAKIYKSRGMQERKKFTDEWKELDEVCEKAGIDIDRIFRYYMHILRAKNGETSREIDIRKFFDKENKYLTDPDLMKTFASLADFWMLINTSDRSEDTEGEGYIVSLKAKQWLHCLSVYPNELWQYPVSVFFLKNKDAQIFDADFCRLLKNLIALLFVKFVNNPTRNAIRTDIYNAYIAIEKGNEITVKPSQDDVSAFEKRIQENQCPSSMVKPLLLLDAYLDNQEGLIPRTFQIEHIFPRKYEDNYHKWSKEDAGKYLEKLGNKVVFEKRLNIQANNGYFENKKTHYAKSHIASVLVLSNHPQNDWDKKDIDERNKKIAEDIVQFIKTNIPNT